MAVQISASKRKSIEGLIENGHNNGFIALKYPGIRKEQINGIREKINPATPETKTKLKFDPVMGLYRKGKIDAGDWQSSQYILAAYLIITADVRGSNASLETFVDNTRKMSGMEESEFQIMVQDQYGVWHEACTKEGIKTGPILHVLTEPVSFKDTDKYFRHQNGTASRLMVEGLKLYSKLF